jgi:hypothetical protein
VTSFSNVNLIRTTPTPTILEECESSNMIFLFLIQDGTSFEQGFVIKDKSISSKINSPAIQAFKNINLGSYSHKWLYGNINLCNMPMFLEMISPSIIPKFTTNKTSMIIFILVVVAHYLILV